MPNVMEDVDFDLIVEEETFEPQPCEGGTHPYGKFGHVIEQFASYLGIPPCGNSWAVCAGWVENASFSGMWTYSGCECGESHWMNETRFIPLNTQ